MDNFEDDCVKENSSLVAEQHVLGSMLKNPESIDLIIEFMSHNYFYYTNHKLISETIFKMFADGLEIDAVTVCEKIVERGADPDWQYLVELQKNSVSFANIISYAHIVKNKYTERSLLNTAAEIVAIVNGDGSIDEKINLTQSLFNTISENEKSAAETSTEIAKRFVQYLDDVGSGKQFGLMTGYDAIDKRIKGFRGGNLIILAARPGMGKTTLAMNLVENWIQQDKTILVFSIEMGKDELFGKSVSSLGKIPYSLIRDGGVLESEHTSALVNAVNILKTDKLLIDDSGSINANTLFLRARKIHRKTKLDAIVVDYLQIVKADKAENRTQEVTKITGALKAMAKELNIPVIALSQLNRSLESRPDKRPMLSDLRESGAIEQDADIILFLYRESYYNENSNDNTCEVNTAKFRGGKTGRDYLSSHLDRCRFENSAYGYEYQALKQQTVKKHWEY